MKLSKTLLAIVAAVAAAGFACNQAQATAITGMLNIGGTATFNTHSLATAKSVTSFEDVTVGGGNTGSFANLIIGAPVAMASPYIFNPSTSTPALWSVGGFTFDLQSSSIITQNANVLAVSGTGTIFGPAGFTPTPGVWLLTTQNPGGHPHATFTFSAGTEATGVPDSGMTVTLLGAGLVGIGLFRARFAKAS